MEEIEKLLGDYLVDKEVLEEKTKFKYYLVGNTVEVTWLKHMKREDRTITILELVSWAYARFNKGND